MTINSIRIEMILIALAAIGSLYETGFSQSTVITYQGRLVQSGLPVHATADFTFSLFDTEISGSLVAGPVSVLNTTVANGLFTVQIDFGSAAFNGQERWLGIAVRSPAGGGSFTTLSPRQKVTAAPYALKVPGLDGFSLDAADGNPTDAVFVDNAGKVGVGTTTPDASLHISKGDMIVGAPGEEWILHSRSAFGGDFLQITDRDAGNGEFKWGQGLTITQAGNVGVGTTNPGALLSLGSSNASSKLLLWDDGVGAPLGIGIAPNQFRFHLGLPVNRFSFLDGPNGNELFTILGTGQVCVNDPNPIGRFSVTAVSGTAISGHSPSGAGGRFTTSGLTSFAVMAISTSTTGQGYGVYSDCASPSGYDFYAAGAGVNYGSTSSIRWKRNIKVIDDPLAKVDAMRGVVFDWDAEHGGQHDVGFIGEEVGKVLPEIVLWEDDGCYVTGMDYSKVTPLLVEAVKALRAKTDAQIADLEAENRTLRDENQALHTRMAALEAAVARLDQDSAHGPSRGLHE